MPVEVIPAKHTSLGDFRFIDIGVNLTDPVFRGVHRGRRKHEDDFEAMLERSRAAGVKSMVITGGSLKESKQALELAKKYGLFATAGCHPTRSTEFDKYHGGPEAYLDALDKLIEENMKGDGRVVAVGECGLDYDRTHFASEDVQKKYFRGLAACTCKETPLTSISSFSGSTCGFYRDSFGEDGGRALGAKGGVVHSFTGSVEEVVEYQDMGFHVSVNGCSMKTEDNLKAAAAIRPDKILFETDAPWCSMTSTHASKTRLDSLPSSLRSLYLPPATQPERFVLGKAVKGRNEPMAIGAVAWVIHRLNEDIPFEKVTEKAWKNTIELFQLEELEL